MEVENTQFNSPLIEDKFIQDGFESTGNQLGLTLDQGSSVDPVEGVWSEKILPTRVEVLEIEEKKENRISLSASSSIPQLDSSYLQELNLTQVEADFAKKQAAEQLEVKDSITNSESTSNYRESNVSTSHSTFIEESFTSSSPTTIDPIIAELENESTSPMTNEPSNLVSSPTPIQRYTSQVITKSPTTPTNNPLETQNNLLETLEESPDPMRIMPSSSNFSRASSINSTSMNGNKSKSNIHGDKKGKAKITGGNGKKITSDRSRSRSMEPTSSPSRNIRESSAPAVLSPIKKKNSISSKRNSTFSLEIEVKSSRDRNQSGSSNSRKNSRNDDFDSWGGEEEIREPQKSALRVRLENSNKGKSILEVGNNSSDVSRIEETEFEDSLMDVVAESNSEPKKLVQIRSLSQNSLIDPLPSDDTPEQPSSSLPPLTQTQYHLPFPSSSLPPLTQTQYPSNLSSPHSSTLPNISQTIVHPIVQSRRLPRAAVKASIIESSQLENDESMDSTQDFIIPKPLNTLNVNKGKGKERRKSEIDKEREYGFELIIETTGSSDAFENDPSISRSNSKSVKSKRIANPLPINQESPQKKLRTGRILNQGEGSTSSLGEANSNVDAEAEVEQTEVEDEVEEVENDHLDSSPLSSINLSSPIREEEEENNEPKSRVRAKGRFTKDTTSSTSDSNSTSPERETKKSIKSSKKKVVNESESEVEAEDGDVESQQSSDSGNETSYSEEEVVKKAKGKGKKVGKKVEKKIKSIPTTKGKNKVIPPVEKVVKVKKAILLKVNKPMKTLSAPPSTSQLTINASSNTSSFNIQVAPIESLEELENSWSLQSMDDLVWCKVGEAENSFWWPGDIKSLRSARPLNVELLLDSKKEILKFSQINIDIESPSSINILSFRSTLKQGRIRFDFNNFNSSSSSTETTTSISSPTFESFNDILVKAISLESSRDDGSESEGEGAEAEEEEEEEQEEEEENDDQKNLEPESDDELTKVDNEATGMTFPFKVLGKSQNKWWPGLILGFIPSIDGKKPGKFQIQWTDKVKALISRKDFLTPMNPNFYTVQLGETKLEVSKSYGKELAEFVRSITSILQLIIDDDYPYAKQWNAAFFASNESRQSLGKSARYGELEEEHLDILRKALVDWIKGSANGVEPVGSSQFEDLPPNKRLIYVSDLLLPLTSLLLHIEEKDFREDAQEELEAELSPAEPTKEAIELRAFELVLKDLDLGSVTKWVESCRNAKKITEKNAKALNKKRRED